MKGGYQTGYEVLKSRTVIRASRIFNREGGVYSLRWGGRPGTLVRSCCPHTGFHHYNLGMELGLGKEDWCGATESVGGGARA